MRRFGPAFGLVRSEGERATQVLRVSHLFTWFLLAQFVMGIGIALFVSTRSELNHNLLHAHPWYGALIGGAVTLPALALSRLAPSAVLSRHIIANTAMLQSLWLIIATGGRIEGHFSVFTVMAICAFYLDWKVFISAGIIGTGYHCVLGHLAPMYVYGVMHASMWRCVEHGLWICYEVIFLLAWVAVRLGAIETIVGLRRELTAKMSSLAENMRAVEELKNARATHEKPSRAEMDAISREIRILEQAVAREQSELRLLLKGMSHAKS